MNELFAAILAAWNGASGAAARAACPGGLWTEEAPEGTPYPYVVVSAVAAPAVIAYGGEMFYNATMRFTAYGLPAQTGPAGTAFALVDALFNAAFPVAGKTMNSIAPGGKPLPRYRGKDKAGNDVWLTTTTYDYAIGA